MNKVILCGRLTRDPEVRYSQGSEPMAVARFSLAVDRRRNKDAEQTADFINCVAFGKSGEFAEKYFHKGTKILLVGRIQSGSYTNKDGATVYTTDVVAEELEFAESKNASGFNKIDAPIETEENPINGFMNIPEDGDLPFAQPTR